MSLLLDCTQKEEGEDKGEAGEDGKCYSKMNRKTSQGRIFPHCQAALSGQGKAKFCH